MSRWRPVSNRPRYDGDYLVRSKHVEKVRDERNGYKPTKVTKVRYDVRLFASEPWDMEGGCWQNGFMYDDRHGSSWGATHWTDVPRLTENEPQEVLEDAC